MKQNLKGIVLTILVLLITACQKEDSLSSSKELISFSILESENVGKIGKDIKADIKGNIISFSLSKYDNIKSLIATFEYKGSKISVNGREQISGVTANNYSQSLNFILQAEDGSELIYMVQVTLKEVAPLSYFGFEKSKNPELPTDVSCIIQGENIAGSIISPHTEFIANYLTEATHVTVGGKEQINGETSNDFSEPVTYQFTMRNGEILKYTVKIDRLLNAIPQFIITTEEAIDEIPSKDYYLDATLVIDGKGIYEDYTGTTQIKGRGNSTWGYPKKPYRLKLNKKSEICGLGQAKNFVLLANYIDPTLMLNSVAFKIGHLLGIPFTNHAIPVDVTFNGKYKGSYLLTEQVEIYESRVNIDPEKSIMWEFDSYFDEDWKFKSDAFNLPIMVKDPDMENQAQFDYWKNDLNAFLNKFNEPLVNNDYINLIDIESVVNYLIVFNLTLNMEINHPKSVYMYKEKNGKYFMGPLWDFDWAYGYEGTFKHFSNASQPLLTDQMGNGVGKAFFGRFLTDARIKELYKKNWTAFRAGKFQELLRYIDNYAEILQPSVKRDSEIWTNTQSFKSKVRELTNWLNKRANYIDSEVTNY